MNELDFPIVLRQGFCVGLLGRLFLARLCGCGPGRGLHNLHRF